MTSAINTGSIDSNYPVPGVNNNSQGFRTNFGTIKNNLNTAANEITDLQNNGIFKSALAGTVLDNNMANSLISNATVNNFSNLSYNLGSNLSGDIPVINKLNGDYQYGIVTGNINTLTFTNWGPSGNYSQVMLSFTFTPNSGRKIGIPSTITAASLATIEGYDPTTRQITVPANTSQITLLFWTTDCGTTINISSIDRPRVATQVISRVLDSANLTSVRGLAGDIPGDIAYSNGNLWVCNSTYGNIANNIIWNQITGGGGAGQSLVNGSSNVVVDPNGNVRFSVTGTANTLSVSNVGITTGNGNFTGIVNSNGANLGNVLGVKITGGLNGQYLQTDGTGNLIWSTVTSGNGAVVSVAGSNTQIQFNDSGNFAGNTGFTFDKLTTTLSVTNANITTATISGNLIAANFSVTGAFNLASANITGNFSVGNNFFSNGNIYANNGTIFANAIQTIGTGAVTVASASTISLIPSGGTSGANANVILGSNGGLVMGGSATIGGSITIGSTNLFLTRRLTSPSSEVGVIGQTVLQIASDETTRLWVCLGGTNWKSVTLT